MKVHKINAMVFPWAEVAEPFATRTSNGAKLNYYQTVSQPMGQSVPDQPLHCERNREYRNEFLSLL